MRRFWTDSPPSRLLLPQSGRQAKFIVADAPSAPMDASGVPGGTEKQARRNAD